MYLFNHYFPILKGHSGEFHGLAQVKKEGRNSMTPVFEVPRKDAIKKLSVSWEKYLYDIALGIARSWGWYHPVYVDFYDVDCKLKIPGGSSLLNYLFKTLRELKVKAIPVVGLERDVEYLEDSNRIACLDDRGICLRLKREDIELIERSILGIEKVSKGIPKEKISILFDFGSINGNENEYISKILIRAINLILDIEKYRAVVFAGTSFPAGYSDIKVDEVKTIKRNEIDIWKGLLSSNKIKRIPSFGDYGIVNPDMPDFDAKFFNCSGKIRYTLDEEWMILKGFKLKSSKDYKQFHRLARKLKGLVKLQVNENWGDKQIDLCSNEMISSGNLTDWVAIDSNRHWASTANQIRNSQRKRKKVVILKAVSEGYKKAFKNN